MLKYLWFKFENGKGRATYILLTQKMMYKHSHFTEKARTLFISAVTSEKYGKSLEWAAWNSECERIVKILFQLLVQDIHFNLFLSKE